MANNYYLEVARALQGRLRGLTAAGDSSDLRKVLEIAAEEFGIPRDEYRYVYNSKRRKASLNVAEEQPSCRHLCSEHEEVMNEDRWGNLPHDLLQLVLAHLPVKEILQLRCLSKAWKESMITRGSDFFRVCDEVHPKMFAFIRYLGNYIEPGNLFLVRVFDINWNRWIAFRISLGNPAAGWSHLKPYWRSFSKDGGSDGGLVLFYLEAENPKKKVANLSFFYTVMNPLTKRSSNLPPILDVEDVLLQHIVVDRETNHYKVLIVVEKGDTNTDDIRVFDSSTGEWSQPNKAIDITFGNESAYDFAKRRLIQLGDPSPFIDIDAVTYTILKNHLFVMLKDTHIPGVDQPPTTVYYIKEYVMEYHPQHPPTWLEMDIHRCGPFERAPKKNNYNLMLHSSNGVLMVFMTSKERKPFQNEKGWIYDLSTRTWRDLPKFSGSHMTDSDRPCEIRWNVYP